MKKKRLPGSLRKFIRQEKARIRREVLDIKKQEELINELYQKLIKIKSIPNTKKEYEEQRIQQTD